MFFDVIEEILADDDNDWEEYMENRSSKKESNKIPNEGLYSKYRCIKFANQHCFTSSTDKE